MKQLYSNCPPNAFMQCFRPSTNYFTFLPSTPAPDLSSNFTEKTSKARCKAPNHCIYAMFQTLNYRFYIFDPLPQQAPSWNFVKKCKLLGPRHLITADLQWFGLPTNDFSFFRPSSQEGLTGIVTLHKASAQGFSLDNASTRIS